MKNSIAEVVNLIGSALTLVDLIEAHPEIAARLRDIAYEFGAEPEPDAEGEGEGEKEDESQGTLFNPDPPAPAPSDPQSSSSQ